MTPRVLNLLAGKLPRAILLAVPLLAASILAVPAAGAAPGLPATASLDPRVPSPAEVLGFEPGERHPRHDQVVSYFRALAAASDRVRVEEIGRTHDGRPLLLAYFARPDRLQSLDALRASRQQASREGAGPPVAWLGYSVHGNEASGASAALVMAWYLAASQSPEVTGWLDRMVIVMEPAINPDGLDRFAHWANMHRGRHPSADPADREHHEAWPNGRTNYYWFDLNRDWMPLTHPESRARVRHYHQWRPHVVTDVHEMGSENSYFFQPGVPERTNALIPADNQVLAMELAERHGEILDAAGEPFYARESYDDYYVGKGSTYPDLTGSVGILFEQGSARGHRMGTPYGERSFADAIANQVRTSISTLRGTAALAPRLLEYQAGFFRENREQARRDRSSGWLVGDGGDPVRAAALIELLLGHEVEIRPVTETVEIDGRRYPPGRAWFVPAVQDHYLLLRSLFEASTEPPAETFYDVSAWPLQHAFNLPLTQPRRAPDTGDPLATAPPVERGIVSAEKPVAWLVPWDQQNAPAVLAALLAEDYRVQAITRPLVPGAPDESAESAESGELVRGSLVIHRGIQPEGRPPVGERLAELGARHGVRVLAADSGLSREGIDLGSPSASMLEAPRIALLTGDGLNPYNAGYAWHWFDTRLQQPVTQLDWSRAAGKLEDYSVVVLPDGRYDRMPDRLAEALTRFVQDGGRLVALRRAAQWVETLELDWVFADAAEAGQAQADAEAPKNGEDEGGDGEAQPLERRAYGDYDDDRGRQQVGGSVLRMRLDLTHPLAFGYRQPEISVLRRGAHALRPAANPYGQPGTYAEEPLMAGFLSAENRDRLAGGTALSVTRHGPGVVVRIADDYLFRGYWRGTETLFANALFFSGLVEDTPPPEPD